MIFVDDRTDDQRRTHNLIVLMTDRFMSGWGEAGNGPSYAGWACQPDDLAAVERWVCNRSDSSDVRVVYGTYRPPSGEGHCHIYVAGETQTGKADHHES